MILKSTEGVIESSTVGKGVKLEGPDIDLVWNQGDSAVIGIGRSNLSENDWSTTAVKDALQHLVFQIDKSKAKGAFISFIVGDLVDNDKIEDVSKGGVGEIQRIVNKDARIFWTVSTNQSLGSEARAIVVLSKW